MPVTLDRKALEDRLGEIPALAGPRLVEELSGGLTNVNLKVTTQDGAYVARCFCGDADLLGIDRDAEHLNTRAAFEAGAGPEVVDYRPDLGILVIRFIEGATLDNQTLTAPGTLPRVAEAMRRLHRGPRFVNDFDMFARQRRYLDEVRELGIALPPGYDAHLPAFHRVRDALAVRARPTVPCNNDLLAGNFVDDGSTVWLIDYEYSGNNDACFELGNTSTECDLAPDQVEELVASYFGGPSRSMLARTRLQMMVSQYGWSLWGLLQSATSQIDFDFRGWGLERFEKAARGFTGDDFPRLIDEVQRDD
jgi:thiamine kinase-like enzyme